MTKNAGYRAEHLPCITDPHHLGEPSDILSVVLLHHLVLARRSALFNPPCTWTPGYFLLPQHRTRESYHT